LKSGSRQPFCCLAAAAFATGDHLWGLLSLLPTAGFPSLAGPVTGPVIFLKNMFLNMVLIILHNSYAPVLKFLRKFKNHKIGYKEILYTLYPGPRFTTY
jgi:hypothetical protein